MSMNLFQGSQNVQIQNLAAYQVEGSLHQHSLRLSAEQSGLFDILQPITDASHTRDRKRSPPDSACFPGTRLQVVRNVNRWARSDIATDPDEPHLRWMHGYVGSGKSSISQEVCDTSEREDRPVISFFFFRNAGDRSKIWRLATTLASQMAAAIPETEPIIRAAVQANPALLAPGEGGVSVRARMQRLVYTPFRTAVLRNQGLSALARGPFLIVLDGLDECDDKAEVQELIDGLLAFFNEHPLIPLRVFITSRVEEHIQSQLKVPGVMLDNLVDHCSDDDIETFLQILFEDACRRNSVVRAYVKQHGEWPTQGDRRKLVEHIGGSFIFASAVFKFIRGMSTEDNDRTTPMDRLPLALKMNPGLDGLYAQTLARSIHLPHFSDIISTIALLVESFSTSEIAELLGIQTYEVINVLANLQAIIQVPGTDDLPVTLCHTSLRDFLTTESRSRGFFVHPSHHVRLFLCCLEGEARYLRRRASLSIPSPGYEQRPTIVRYTSSLSVNHLFRGGGFFKAAVRLCCQALGLQPKPDTHRLLQLITLVRRITERTDVENVIFRYRKVIGPQLLPPPMHSTFLMYMGETVLERYRCTRVMADLVKAISLYRQAFKFRPSPDIYRSLLNQLGYALLERHLCTDNIIDLEEAIALLHESIYCTTTEGESGEDTDVNGTLSECFSTLYLRSGSLPHLQESITCWEKCAPNYPVGTVDRPLYLRRLASLLQLRVDVMGQAEDLASIARLKEEAEQLSANSFVPDIVY